MPRRETPDIYDDLRARLIEGGFAPGRKLKPAELQQDYGCSTNTVRDVLLRLAAEGLAEFRDQRGFRMPERSAQKQHEVAQMRILLEQEGACLSLQYGGIDWEGRLTAVHHKLLHLEKRIRHHENPDSLVAHWLEAEEEFHQTLISACASDTLIGLHRQIYAQFRQQHVAVDRAFAFITENIAQHQAIVDAALEGDPGKVRSRIHAHLERNLSPQHPKVAELARRG
ncbi:GntR family transcriptional regulator [Litoreibacter ponti]|uniref:GntR family transcriptional regulator n=1 Tax=Litoreibacter ponti TaxID=1510457 RepID=A0A2T6BDS7_9RHOB|nr:GntR family transcriptional regulator [Litoreibacter ponti]PTX54228.1 GntR family transcriptional regulator [Litoreibacter ponti]